MTLGVEGWRQSRSEYVYGNWLQYVANTQRVGWNGIFPWQTQCCSQPALLTASWPLSQRVGVVQYYRLLGAALAHRILGKSVLRLVYFLCYDLSMQILHFKRTSANHTQAGTMTAVHVSLLDVYKFARKAHTMISSTVTVDKRRVQHGRNV